MTDPFRCVWWRGLGSGRRWPTALRPCRWHASEADCVCINPNARATTMMTAPLTVPLTPTTAPFAQLKAEVPVVATLRVRSVGIQ